jgi:glycosyltransferase involved in cell wall biosynthesis
VTPVTFEKLLFIAPTVPLYDRNAGDLRLFTILNILSTSYDITYLALNRASSKLDEDNPYVSRLKDLGVSVYIKNFSITDILRSNRFKAAILEFYKIAEHYLPRIKILQPSCPVIVDTVDLHYLRLHRKYQITKDSKDLRVMEETKTRELAVYGQADIILVVTDSDARSLQDANPDIAVRILPTIHPLVSPTNTGNSHEIIFVGGFRHAPNVDAVIYFCENILPQVRKVIKEARFTIVGSNPPVEVKTLSNDFITVTGYVPSVTPYLQKSFVSVAPIRYGAGIKGKIGEAMAHGLPVVTTSIGAEGMGLITRENAMIVDSPEKFADAVIELMMDNNLYRKIQQNALEHIEKNYTPERVAKQLEHIMAELTDLHVKKMSIGNKTSFVVEYARNFVRRKLS